MDWQLPVALGVVILAAAYLVRKAWKTLKNRKKACAGGCGCPSSSVATPANSTLVSISMDKLKVLDGHRLQKD